MSEDELMLLLLSNLHNLRCANCGKNAQEYTTKGDVLLGCLHFGAGDASVGLDEYVYWLCPEHERGGK